MDPAARRRELAAFLRSRRQRLDPVLEGFTPGTRLTPGLRREEVAALAGVSLSWYTWLEQARPIRPSPEVLQSIARALRLDEAEREYLLRLGGHAPRDGAVDRSDPRSDPQLQALVDAFLPNPASILTPGFDYVAWNRVSERLVPGFLGCGPDIHNLMRFIFYGDAVCNPVEGPPEGPGALVARLRANVARHPEDPTAGALVEELSDVSADFTRLWRLQEVAPLGPPPDVPLVHPDAGRLLFQQLDLRPETHPELTLVVFLPRDAETAAGLTRLAP